MKKFPEKFKFSPAKGLVTGLTLIFLAFSVAVIYRNIDPQTSGGNYSVGIFLGSMVAAGLGLVLISVLAFALRWLSKK